MFFGADVSADAFCNRQSVGQLLNDSYRKQDYPANIIITIARIKLKTTSRIFVTGTGQTRKHPLTSSTDSPLL